MRFLSNLIASTLGVLLAFGLLFFFLLMFLFAVALSADQAPTVRSGSVLVLNLAGDVPEVVSGDALSQAFGGEPAFDLYRLKRALRRAAADDRIDALWIQMQGMDASWATLQEVRAAVLRFQESGKPVIASSDDYAMDESDYFLASAADSVFAAPEAFFEFNGFFLTGEFYTGLLEKLGIEPQIIRVGQYKSAVEPFFRIDFSEENEQQLRDMLTSWNSVFMQAVAERRGLTPEALQVLAEEAVILTAEDAYEADLLDGLLFRDQVVELLKARLGYEADDDLRRVEMKNYVRVPDEEAGLEVGDEAEVAIVYAVGGITSGHSGFESNPLFGGRVVGAETFNEAMREAREDEDVAAVVLRIDSPGGSASAANAMWREIELTADEKPVVVSMGTYAASGGYWIAAPAHTIVADPLTLTGSIGVFSVFFDVSELLEDKIGINFDLVQTSPYADMFSGLSSLSPEEEAILQRTLQDTYASFLEKVARGRDLEIEAVDAVAQGRVWTGAQAKEVGLVDELGGLERAIDVAAELAELEEDSYRTRILPRPKTFLEQMSEMLNARAAKAWLSLSASPAERALLHQAQLFRELKNEHGRALARMPFHFTIR